MSPDPSRRAFFKLGAALVAAATVPRPGPSLAAAFPASATTYFQPDAEALAAEALRFDAVLAPAYAAAGLIRAGAVRQLAGAGWRGRAHDPDGAFTLPHVTARLMLIYRGPRPARPSLADAFQPGALWLDYGRLALSAALLRRGDSPNDAHPGRINRAAQDLADARPRFVRDPARALAAGYGQVAVALLRPEAESPGAALPSEGVLALEFDWAVTRAAARPGAVEAVVRADARPAVPDPASFTLTPLPSLARRHYAEAWARVRYP
jgi:hypothetical protein